ncbi:MAG: hypothetical protein LBJ00_11610 [Planctomycetaceae bacterium]|jgi:diacylglycerol kinase family enzyme|nr:hypothetical protein [Planctomycetaceae bacterium]
MKVIISVNPKAGRSSSFLRAQELFDQLELRGFQAELLTDIEEALGKANQFFADGSLRAIVGVGGDGTAATLVNRTAKGTPITILPAGTANLISKHFRLPSNPAKLAEMIENGKLITLDAGKVTFSNNCKSCEDKSITATENNDADKTANEIEKIFLVMVSCGLDADIVNGVHSQREERYKTGHKKGAHISYLSYIKPIFKSMFKYRYAKMKVEQFVDGEYVVVDERTKWVFIFNLNRYGWGLPLAPSARGNDGKLDHVLFRGGSVIFGAVYVLFAQCFSSHKFLPTTKLGQSTKYRISTTSDAKIPFQLDGDPAGNLPVEVEIIKDRFTLLVGNNTLRD